MMRVFVDTDADQALVKSRRVAIVGYGNQGRAQALNLRDSGVSALCVAVRAGGDSAGRAAADGFTISDVGQAAGWADIVVMLIPDELQADVFALEIAPHLRPGSALVFAHGFAIRFGLIAPRPDIDVLLVAPKGPGTALRSEYERGAGLVSLFAVAQNASGSAEALALSYAAALGSGRAGMLRTTFAEECEADLFNEGAVLWGAVPELIQAGYETLVEAGFAPEIAYMECVSELKLLADLIHARGIAGMREAISNTAEFGAVAGGGRIVTEATRAEMRNILSEVRDGSFAGKLTLEAKAGYPALRRAREAASAQSMEEVGRRLRALDSKV
jgi:ketol-acid reductoisomerase